MKDIAVDDHSRARVAIHVNPDGSMAVDAAIGFSESSIKLAVQKRARWVVNHVVEARDRYAHVRPKEYVSGEQVLYLGRRYVLKVVPVDKAVVVVRLKGNRLEVQSTSGNPDDIKGRIRAWYRVKGRDYLARRMNTLTQTLPWSKSPPPFRLLEMSSRWGSGSPAGEIILNPHLIKAPRNCIDYVLIHEMAHLRHHDHSPEFWKLIDAHAGDWRKAKYHLDALVEVLISE
ncbi:MAG: SprT family zinc-dependent metalloprotease [Pseudotabrizicola sp.]|uniref:M48 family metallopeptidase n=1 Tax=Pseudotabrizicola sp. TaxID=2939647 RepID=UPI0027310C19|nr:SprT family zinc-dependent metalloprotease [Pseudotabrizicola sp.]MDP2080833.1 SprT family zinc-dependent metalloprotease [Pseudotabrizicola sp.]MDZ7572765.1 SprT family zinc-dependent metalloprotease [Pseudotabrizicola sp.]